MRGISEAEADEAGRALFEAERTRTQLPLLSLRHPEMDLAAAYAVQARLVAAREAAGHRRIGWKIGLTSRAMQDALGIDTPDSGVLFDDMQFPDGGTVPGGRYIQPRIEAELAFVLAHDLSGEADRAAVLAATDHVRPALEILDTRILRRDAATGRARTIVDTVADNAANAGLVLGGERIDPHADLRWIGAIVTRDGVVEETGLGAGVLGDPVEGVVWLARRLSEYGARLAAGDVVLSGSFVRPVEAPPGSAIVADFGPHGTVSITFACEAPSRDI